MTIHQCCRFALASALALLAPALAAGEIVLFDAPNFQGANIAFRGTVPNLDGTGFNDRAASISVRDGTWEVCFDADFQGGCMQLQPGDYPRLDPPFDRSISSLREVSGAASYAAPAPQQAAAANEITLFDGDNFQGDRIAFGGSVPNLDGTGFNDRAASISVRGGPWEVCFDADFQGGCMQLQPGDYPRLDPPFDRNISSVRPLDGAGYGGTDAASQASFGGEVAGTSIGIDLPAYPELVPVPGYPVYYAPQLNSNYFFYDGMYWVYQRDNWYASSWYNGPWGLVAPAVVPLFVLRVPVGYYRRPPVYFRGWSANAPPRWGDRWGNTWVQGHRGWDNWNRNAVPPPAPLPLYQRQYSGYRYPPAAQQRTLQSQNYRYQPQDAVVRQHYQAQQQGQAPTPRGQPPQRAGGGGQQPAPTPTPPGTAPYPRGQPSQTGGPQGQRPPTPMPYQQGAAPASRGQPPQTGGPQGQRPPDSAPYQQGAAPAPRGPPPPTGSRQGQRPAESTPYQGGVAPPSRGPSPQTGGRDNQRPGAVPAPSQPGGATAGQPRQQPGAPPPQSGQRAPTPQGGDKGAQGKPPPQEPKQGATKELQKGDPRSGEPGK